MKAMVHQIQEQDQSGSIAINPGTIIKKPLIYHRFIEIVSVPGERDHRLMSFILHQCSHQVKNLIVIMRFTD